MARASYWAAQITPSPILQSKPGAGAVSAPQRRKLRLAQGHTAGKPQRGNQNPGLAFPLGSPPRVIVNAGKDSRKLYMCRRSGCPVNQGIKSLAFGLNSVS